MLEARTRGDETPDKESQEVMKELGIEESPKEEQPKEETPSEEPKSEPQEEIAPVEENKERKPREMPLWKHEVEKKQLQKHHEEEKSALQQQLDKISSDFEEFKRGHSKQEITDKKDEVSDKLEILANKYEVDGGFIRELFDIIPKSSSALPEDITEKLKSVDDLREKARIQQENYEFNVSFVKKVAPKLKEEFPNISDEEIEQVKKDIEKHYYSDKYISLDTDEIFTLKKSELTLPTKKTPSEKGTRGVARGEKPIDYEGITEEQYSRLSPEEQEKVENYLIAKERSRR